MPVALPSLLPIHDALHPFTHLEWAKDCFEALFGQVVSLTERIDQMDSEVVQAEIAPLSPPPPAQINERLEVMRMSNENKFAAHAARLNTVENDFLDLQFELFEIKPKLGHNDCIVKGIELEMVKSQAQMQEITARLEQSVSNESLLEELDSMAAKLSEANAKDVYIQVGHLHECTKGAFAAHDESVNKRLVLQYEELDTRIKLFQDTVGRVVKMQENLNVKLDAMQEVMSGFMAHAEERRVVELVMQDDAYEALLSGEA